MLVIKIGSSLAQGEKLERMVAAMALIKERFILVHGGGRLADPIFRTLSIEPEKVISTSGVPFRRTTAEVLRILNMVAGDLNSRIVALFAKNSRLAIGLSGVSAGLIIAKRKNPIIKTAAGKTRVLRDDYTGLITKVNTGFLEKLLAGDLIPVISFIALSEEFELLNCDADRVGAALSITVRAEKLVLFSDVPGFLANGKVVPLITVGELNDYIDRASGGMKRKLMAAQEALQRGVREVLITDSVDKIKTNSGTLLV